MMLLVEKLFFTGCCLALIGLLLWVLPVKKNVRTAGILMLSLGVLALMSAVWAL